MNKRETQKLKTRQALLRAAREIMRRQEPVSIVAAAEIAGVSQATAYRYFSDPETMQIEAMVELDLGEAGDFMADLERRCAGLTRVTDRIIAAQRLMTEFLHRNEAAYRLFLAKGHEQVVNRGSADRPAPRGGRRIPMIEFALEPWRMDLTGRKFRQAVLTLATVCGTDSHFVLVDLCGLDRKAAATIAEDTLCRVVASLAAEFGLPA